MSNIFVNFYTRLFSSTGPLELDRVLEGVNQIVNDDMNVELTKPYTQEEVDAAIKQMSLLKAPSPDGMPPLFYQSFWSKIGPNVSEGVLSSLNSSTLLKSINYTFITLIPKVNSPENIFEYTPISLCNALYKILSKVTANKLKPILNSIVFEA